MLAALFLLANEIFGQGADSKTYSKNLKASMGQKTNSVRENINGMDYVQKKDYQYESLILLMFFSKLTICNLLDSD